MTPKEPAPQAPLKPVCAICRGPLRDDERAIARFKSGYHGRVCVGCARRLADKRGKEEAP